jgi:hypothetical protein
LIVRDWRNDFATFCLYFGFIYCFRLYFVWIFSTQINGTFEEQQVSQTAWTTIVFYTNHAFRGRGIIDRFIRKPRVIVEFFRESPRVITEFFRESPRVIIEFFTESPRVITEFFRELRREIRDEIARGYSMQSDTEEMEQEEREHTVNDCESQEMINPIIKLELKNLKSDESN